MSIPTVPQNGLPVKGGMTSPVDRLSRALLVAGVVAWSPSMAAQRVVTHFEAVPPLTLEYALKDSDLVVHGTIAEGRVAVDQDVVRTDYTVHTRHTLYQRSGTPPDGRFLAVNTIVFRITGGTAIVNGELITERDRNFPEAPFKVGEDFILLLRFFPEWRRYVPVAGPFGAFRIEQARVRQLVKNSHEKRPIEGMPTPTFVQLIRQLLPQK